jgi:VWFA-related protein
MERLMARRVILLYLFMLAAGTGSGFCQNAPANGDANPAAKQTAPAAGAGNAVTTLKATAQLVLVDVVVLDNNRKPVHGLKASDFSLTEGGVPQTVKHFEEHAALTQADATKFPPVAKLPPGIFTNYTPAPANGAVNLILLDTLNTPMKDQAYVRQQLMAYLKATPPGTRIAIFGLTTRLIILQGFTSDPDLLRRVMEKGVAKGSPLLDDPVGGGGIQNSEADNLEDMLDSGAVGSDAAALVANMREFDAVQQSFQSQLRAKYTLDAMSQIARYLSNIPGRKNLIWFSGSFPIDVMPDITGTLPDPFAVMADSEAEFRDTVNLLARSQVAVYPIDARGLTTSPIFSAATSRNYVGARATQDEQKFFSDTAQEQGTMLAMADATGGHAFVNSNGLTAAVATAIEEGTNFYTLTYTPTNSQRDGKLRKIHVDVSRPGVMLAYRKGYYADDPNAKHAVKVDAATTAAGAPTPRDTLHYAMTRGVPAPAEVLIKVGVVPITPEGQTEDKVAPDNEVTAKAKGPFRRYSVNYAIDPAGLVYLQGPDGKIHADFDLIIFVFTPEGELVNSKASGVHIAKTLDDLRKALDQGLIFHEEISAPAKGEYFLRIGVHELHDDHYGAVEVATSSVRNVRPAKASTAVPTGAAR